MGITWLPCAPRGETRLWEGCAHAHTRFTPIGNGDLWTAIGLECLVFLSSVIIKVFISIITLKVFV